MGVTEFTKAPITMSNTIHLLFKGQSGIMELNIEVDKLAGAHSMKFDIGAMLMLLTNELRFSGHALV